MSTSWLRSAVLTLVAVVVVVAAAPAVADVVQQPLQPLGVNVPLPGRESSASADAAKTAPTTTPPATTRPATTPPATTTGSMATTNAPSRSGCVDVDVAGAGAGGAVDDGSIQARLRGALSAGNLTVAILLVLLGGLLTALSPCVYPLIPITLSILGARQAGSARKGFLLAATYVAGMVVLYTTLGVSFASAGMLAGSALQSPLVTIGVAAFCVVMAASMFGAFELVLPSSLQTRLSQAGGGGFKGAFVMGLVAGIIAAPCTGPVLSFILTLIAREHDLVKGAMLMFFYALGMGLPFLVLGTFSQAIARMPKSGRWMETVKSVFGLLMLGAGLYYLQIGLPSVAAVFAPLGARGLFLGPLLVVVGVVVGALHLSFKYTPLAEKLRKGGGVALATTGIVAFLAWTNAPAVAAELPPTTTSTTTSSATATTTTTPGAAVPPIEWLRVGAQPTALDEFDRAVAAAKRDCRPVMIDFGAEWCIACKELEKIVYVDPAVVAEAKRFVNIKVDATDETPALTELQKRFGVVGLPTVAFIDKTGRYLDDAGAAPRHAPLTGFVEAEDYLALMKKVP
jgi:thiol:disulfide interchange protein DsbD